MLLILYLQVDNKYPTQVSITRGSASGEPAPPPRGRRRRRARAPRTPRHRPGRPGAADAARDQSARYGAAMGARGRAPPRATLGKLPECKNSIRQWPLRSGSASQYTVAGRTCVLDFINTSLLACEMKVSSAAASVISTPRPASTGLFASAWAGRRRSPRAAPVRARAPEVRLCV